MLLVLRSPVRVLTKSDVDAALGICRRFPLDSVMVHGMVAENRRNLRKLGGELWGHYNDGTLESMCWAGANLVPVALTPAATEAFVARARRQGRHCSSIVGPADQVSWMWEGLRDWWDHPREIRPSQPLLVMDGPPPIAADHKVRFAEPADLPILVPASIAMFTEEVGYSPVAGGNEGPYKRRIRDLIDGHRCFTRIERIAGQDIVAFKADIGALSDDVAQIQGVWVNPVLRGTGLAAPAMAQVVRLIHQRFGVRVSLYVNDFNTRALKAYRRCGFVDAGEFATILF